MFGFSYNRQNYQFDQTLQWQRFLWGRKYAVQQAAMFRQDVSDLTGVAIGKLKNYAPIMSIITSTCIQIFVQGRFGLGRPAPMTFTTAMYLQCFGISFGFFILGIWLVYHAAIRAQIASVQLRTRRVRLPVPSQRQLDSARKLLSSFEEQTLYDVVRCPFIMPNSAASKDGRDYSKLFQVYSKRGAPGLTASLLKEVVPGKAPKANFEEQVWDGPDLRMPGLTRGYPYWIEKEMEIRSQNPRGSPSGFGMDGPPRPLEHFETLRQCQKDWWGAEAYTRVCFLFGILHFIQANAYWLVTHCIAEQMFVWSGILCSGTLMCALWVVFRLDVLPGLGGNLPLEASGPFLTAIALALGYTADGTQETADLSKALAIIINVMQIVWTFRLYSVARPARSSPDPGARALEAGGRLFNESAACDKPSWLPSAFQHVEYLVAPPKTAVGEETLGPAEKVREEPDPLERVDMTPWHYTRTLLLVVFCSWSLLLAGRITEVCLGGERMFVTNPGTPPWSRVGSWNGWENGAVTSKAFAHVTPVRGHFFWSKGWGPQGQQRRWPTGLFGNHPEADAWWAEEEGPRPLVGAAGIGRNSWAQGELAYGASSPAKPKFLPSRLRRLGSVVRSAMVPAPIAWPPLLEPERLVCGFQDRQVLALNAAGLGVFVPAGAAAGATAGAAVTVAFEGLFELGSAIGAAWRNADLLIVVTTTGALVQCAMAVEAGHAHCEPLAVPRLPPPEGEAGFKAAAVLPSKDGRLSVALSGAGRKVLRLSLVEAKDAVSQWQLLSEVLLPDDVEGEVVSLSASPGNLLALTSTGAALQWSLSQSQPLEFHQQVPIAAASRTWHSACLTSEGAVVRLASRWRRSQGGGDLLYTPELLL